MGTEKFRRPLQAPGVRSAVYVVTSTGTVLPADGTVSINAATDKTFRLPTPRLGSKLTVTAVDSTSVLAIRTLTSAETFFNSTKQGASFSTAADRKVIQLEGVGTLAAPKWLPLFASTGTTIA